MAVLAIPTHYQALSEYLGDHLRTEEGALIAYEQLLEGRPDDIASYLIRMILRDESRHHEIFAELRNTLESSLQWRDIEPRVPSTHLSADDAEALLETTDELLKLEMEDAKELKRLRKHWEREPGERQLWALLVETAELDTKKHIRILRYLRDILREATD